MGFWHGVQGRGQLGWKFTVTFMFCVRISLVLPLALRTVHLVQLWLECLLPNPSSFSIIPHFLSNPARMIPGNEEFEKLKWFVCYFV